MARSKETRARLALDNPMIQREEGNTMFKPTYQMLQNDMAAMKLHAQRDQQQIENLTKRAIGAENALAHVLRERDDWREAFRTVSKLVK